MDKHTIALISIIGSSLDVLGALYLAYDLLGGEHGPLRTLTRFVTYSAVFGIGYGLVLGPVFGLACGATHGISLTWEFSRASRGMPRGGFWLEAAASGIRGCGFALASWYAFGPLFGITFGVMSTVGQTIAYHFGVRPTADYRPAKRPRITRLQVIAGMNRTVGYALTGYLSSIVAQQHEHAISIGLRTGLAIGFVTVLAGAFTPYIEWTADHIPARRMGVYGVILILAGFTLQSVQYWLALLQ